MDKTDKQLWSPERDISDVMREALFDLLCYKRMDQQQSVPAHTQHDQKKVYAPVRASSVFFSSKPKTAYSSEAIKLYEVPETDKTFHANFLRLFKTSNPTFEMPADHITDRNKDTELWARCNYAYFGQGSDEKQRQQCRQILFAICKRAYQGTLGDNYSFFTPAEAKETAEHIKNKR